MSDAPKSTFDMLAELGLTLSAPRIRSTIGKDALNVLTKQGQRVFVFGKEANVDTLDALAKIAEAAGIPMVRETEKGSASVRAAVTNTAKARKVSVVCSAIRNTNEETIGYDVLRTK